MWCLWQWHCSFSTSGHKNCMKNNFMCTACRELYFQTIQEDSLEFIFVCAHEYICLLSFGTSCAFSIWGYKKSWGTPWSPAGIPAQSGFRGDGKFDSGWELASFTVSIEIRSSLTCTPTLSLYSCPWHLGRVSIIRLILLNSWSVQWIATFPRIGSSGTPQNGDPNQSNMVDA